MRDQLFWLRDTVKRLSIVSTSGTVPRPTAKSAQSSVNLPYLAYSDVFLSFSLSSFPSLIPPSLSILSPWLLSSFISHLPSLIPILDQSCMDLQIVAMAWELPCGILYSWLLLWVPMTWGSRLAPSSSHLFLVSSLLSTYTVKGTPLPTCLVFGFALTWMELCAMRALSCSLLLLPRLW